MAVSIPRIVLDSYFVNCPFRIVRARATVSTSTSHSSLPHPTLIPPSLCPSASFSSPLPVLPAPPSPPSHSLTPPSPASPSLALSDLAHFQFLKDLTLQARAWAVLICQIIAPGCIIGVAGLMQFITNYLLTTNNVTIPGSGALPLPQGE